MNTVTQILDANQLIGFSIGNDADEKTFNNEQLQSIARNLGYKKAQVRSRNAMYDCMYDVTRLQLHVDDNNQIVEIRIG